MKTPSSSRSAESISRSRLEFLFDGIFAIAMTILVLELRVPDLTDRHSVSELGQHLMQHASTFVSYLLSFAMLGILWYSHNQQYRHFQSITRVMLGLTLVQLASAAFFPFCAALFGRYPINRLSQVIYIGCIMVYQWCSLGLWLAAKSADVVSAELAAPAYRKIRKGNLFGTLFCTTIFLAYLASTAMAW